jgi:hypothetical protein
MANYLTVSGRMSSTIVRDEQSPLPASWKSSPPRKPSLLQKRAGTDPSPSEMARPTYSASLERHVAALSPRQDPRRDQCITSVPPSAVHVTTAGPGSPPGPPSWYSVPRRFKSPWSPRHPCSGLLRWVPHSSPAGYQRGGVLQLPASEWLHSGRALPSS